MKAVKIITLSLIYSLVKSQVPEGSVINSCGLRGYSMPNQTSDCKSDYGYCCYVKMKVNGAEKSFCASSPSDIKLKDVKDDIDDYTNSELEDIACNDGLYIKFGLFMMLFLFYIL